MSTQYKAWLVITGYEQTEFIETCAPVGKLTAFRYLISVILTCGWKIRHMDTVSAFPNPEIDDDVIYMTLPDACTDGLNAPKIIVRLIKALNGVKHAPQLWHNNIKAFLLSPGITQCSADPDLYLRGDGIQILLYLDNISMSYLEAAATAVIEVNSKLLEKYTITSPGPPGEFLGMEIHCDGTSGKKYSVRAEWLGQSGRAPSEPSETPRWRITPRPAAMERVALYVALRSLFHCLFAFCRSPILNDHSGVVANCDNTSEWVHWVHACIGIAM